MSLLTPLVAGQGTRSYVDVQFADPKFEEGPGWPAWHQGGTPFRDLEFDHCRLPANLVGLGFADCQFRRCVFPGYVRSSEFVRCEFIDCRFDHAAVVSTKIKFCRFRRCTFRSTAIYRCDLYRADFRPGNIFPGAELGLVSLSHSNLDGARELRRGSFAPFQDGAEAPPAARVLRALVTHPLIQEDPRQYEELLGSTHLNAPRDETLARRLIESADVYRALSALWLGAGAYDDAGWAYRKSRRMTRASLAPGRRSAVPDRYLPLAHPEKGLDRAALWAGLAVAGPLCGFGTRLRGIVAALVVMVVGFAALLRLFSVVEVTTGSGAAHDGGWFDAVRYSVGQLATTPPPNMTLTGAGWSFAADLETLIGIALLGLFGFVLANRLRYS